MEDFTIHLATPNNFRALEELERQIWQKNNRMMPFDAKFFKEWCRLYPSGFALALNSQKKEVGFVCFQRIKIIDIEQITTFDETTDRGYTTQTHHPRGNYHFGITLCSNSRGAGKLLYNYALDYSEQQGIPLLTPTRLPTFAKYYAGLSSQKKELGIKNIFLSYLEICKRIIDGLPEPKKIIRGIDPLFYFYYTNKRIRIRRIIPDFMDDPKSKNFSILFEQII